MATTVPVLLDNVGHWTCVHHLRDNAREVGQRAELHYRFLHVQLESMELLTPFEAVLIDPQLARRRWGLVQIPLSYWRASP
jgi:hypothetical protein